jgi:UDPglucose--hexose-1-phosphate uridylyltransferase
MPELRQDPITLRWVAIATERAKRPTAFTRSEKSEVEPAAKCPFCEGHEGMTPPEVMAFRASGTAPNSPGWEFRVVPNLYPAFGPADAAPDAQSDGIYRAMRGSGIHEVLVDSPDHRRDIADFDVPKVDQIIKGYIDRYHAAAVNPFVKYVLLIVNHGREAGASLEHPHSQLFGIPLVPESIAEEFRGVVRHRLEHGECPYCAMIAHERALGSRVVYENDDFVVFAPYASRVPFESWVVPKAHGPRFQTMSEKQRRGFAEAVHVLFAKLKRGLNDPPFNFFIHTGPVRDGEVDYHWHGELLPKLAIAAGFELGTGVMINVATPESAAEFLRGVDEKAPAAAPEISDG